jgi:hypothetical protein
VTFVDLIVATIYYWARMNTRSKKTGSMLAYNWVDITSLILWISLFILFVPFFFMYPFHWLNNEKLDWVIGWYIVNLLGDIVPALSFIFFFWYLIVAAGSGGDEETCISGVCFFNKNYVSPLDGWLNWFFYTIFSGGSYFMLFWFGADSVRYLLPTTDYSMYYLWPGLIYELLVVLGAAPDVPRQVGGYDEIWRADKNATAAHKIEDKSDGETFLDETTVATVDEEEEEAPEDFRDDEDEAITIDDAPENLLANIAL